MNTNSYPIIKTVNAFISTHENFNRSIHTYDDINDIHYIQRTYKQLTNYIKTNLASLIEQHNNTITPCENNRSHRWDVIDITHLIPTSYENSPEFKVVVLQCNKCLQWKEMFISGMECNTVFFPCEKDGFSHPFQPYHNTNVFKHVRYNAAYLSHDVINTFHINTRLEQDYKRSRCMIYVEHICYCQRCLRIMNPLHMLIAFLDFKPEAKNAIIYISLQIITERLKALFSAVRLTNNILRYNDKGNNFKDYSSEVETSDHKNISIPILEELKFFLLNDDYINKFATFEFDKIDEEGLPHFFITNINKDVNELHELSKAWKDEFMFPVEAFQQQLRDI